jgi:predicted nucleotidyltransferase
MEEAYVPMPDKFELISPNLDEFLRCKIVEMLEGFGVSEAYFFGSRIRGVHAADSDYDIAIEGCCEERHKHHWSCGKEIYVIDLVVTSNIRDWAAFVCGVVRVSKKELADGCRK